MTPPPPVWRDGPVLAFMVSETVIWASIFYSFPALVLEWKDEFGWSATAALGAFSLALALQGLAAPWVGRAIDRGLAPWGFALGTLGALAGLAALTQVETLWAFYAVWAWMGLMMGFTLYDACFSVVTRARGAQARAAITAITLAAGFASTLTYPLTAWVSGGAAGARRSGCWRRWLLVFVLPLASYAAHKMEREAQARTPAATAAGTARTRVSARPGYWPLAGGFALTALGVGIILSNLMPLMAALGVPEVLAILAASTIGLAAGGRAHLADRRGRAGGGTARGARGLRDAGGGRRVFGRGRRPTRVGWSLPRPKGWATA